ncbi:MAG: histidine kinase, partial [Rhodothermales bacterium]
TRLIGAGRLGRARFLIYLPTLVMGAAASIAALRGSLGPFSLNSLIAPILFYACCYVATAAALIFTLYVINAEEAEERLGGWSRTGSAITLVISLLMALLVLGVLPLFGPVPDKTAAWLIVSAQLLSLGPVILVSLATLRQGKIDQVLSRALTYLTVLGLIFFAFIGGLVLLQRYVPGFFVSQKILAAFFVVLLLLVFERVARRLRIYANRFFTTDRQAMRQRLLRFQEQMGNILKISDLAQKTAHLLGDAYNARSVLLFIRPTDSASTWFSGAYHPEPPYLTERIASQVWADLEKDGHLWSSTPELNESDIPQEIQDILIQRKAALTIPIMIEDTMQGLVVMGPKKRRRALYNLEDVDLLRGLSGQLALAVERLLLVEREKMLIRMSAEAELKALRAQINPHFLFNALNTIISLIEERPEEAEETVQNLSAIFRHTLQTSSRSFIPLEDEINLVNQYLSIEKARFGDRLTVDEFLDPAVQNHPVPAFVVQTIVENSIKHGLEKKRGKGTLKIICKTNEEGFVEVCVWDSGVGIPHLFDGAEDKSFYGIGLGNIAMRLEKLYGRPDLLRMSSTPDKGTEVKLILPERVHNEDEPAAILSEAPHDSPRKTSDS